MSLSKAVKFQFLAAQLTENETRLFINSVLQNHSQYIKMALFHRITILNIIQTRKKKPKPIKKQNIKLDSIPKSLIGVIASFLNQKNYINFSKCNRYIYLGCNTPNLIQVLILYKKPHSSVNLCFYASIKCLVMNMNKMNKLMTNTNRLKTMVLDVDKRHDCDINSFMTQNIINTNTVTELTLFSFGKSNNKFDNVKFIQLLTKCPNINYLQFKGVYSDFDPNDITKLYPNLNCLALFTNIHQINMSLLHLFATNLKYLGLREYTNRTNYYLNSFMFSKLEELRLRRPTNKSIDNILNTATNLQNVFIETTYNNKCFISSNETETIIKKLIISCKSLENIHFKDNGNLFESILNGIGKE